MKTYISSSDEAKWHIAEGEPREGETARTFCNRRTLAQRVTCSRPDTFASGVCYRCGAEEERRERS